MPSLNPFGYPLQASQFSPARDGRPLTSFVLEEPMHYLLTVQEVGDGYEATVRSVDAEKYGRMAENAGAAPKRKRGSEPMTEENAQRAARRAKRKVRWLCKWIGADRMLTFTTREHLATLDEAAGAWGRFLRIYKRAVKVEEFGFVVGVERHQSGYYHLHVAVSGFFNLRLAHRLWQIALGGRGNEKGADVLGTIDMDKRARGKRPAWRIARYISKYLAKDFADPLHVNRKRYWASRTDLPKPRRMWLEGETFEEAVKNAWRKLAVPLFEVNRQGQLMLAEVGQVCWWYWSPSFAIEAMGPFAGETTVPF